MTTHGSLPHANSAGCNSTGVIHSVDSRGHWERTARNHIRICECGYATPVTTKLTAASAVVSHRCRDLAQLELPLDLPAVAASAVVHYLADRRNANNLDVDTAVVLRFAAGDHALRLNPLERIAVFALMRARGVDVKFCAQVLRLSWSTQARYRRLLEAAS